jgi:hypothetical protein
LDFARAYQTSPQHHLYFVVNDKGPEEPIRGLLHINGKLTEHVLALEDSVVIQWIPSMEPRCFMVDLVLLMLSLSISFHAALVQHFEGDNGHSACGTAPNAV